MKKSIKVSALLLLLTQISLCLGAISFANALEADTAQYNLTPSGSLKALSEPELYANNGLYFSSDDLSGADTGNHIVALSTDKDGTPSGLINPSNYRHDFLLDNFWKRYSERIFLLLFVLFGGILFWGYTLIIKSRNYKQIAASENMLRNISSNINGGVLVLNPQKEYQISYVNEGLLKLMGYSEQEFRSLYDKDYYYFILPEDRRELKKLLGSQNAPINEDDNFSVTLRVRNQDGKFIPTLVKGSFVQNERNEKELFCMIVDISREQAIVEELRFEQECHNTLLEKSDEMLFEINYLEQTVKVSQQFKEKFGWSLPKKYWGDEEPNLTMVYEEDRWKFSQTLQEIKNGAADGELVFRVCKKDGTPCWCKAIYHVMCAGAENKRLIGKLTDIDDEIKEKQSLMTRAQVDALTGIYNKDAFRNRCMEYFSKYPDGNSAVIFFDVDNFKDINDCLGHAVGDRALQDISRRLVSVFSSRDILGRFGGDEFCVLLKEVTREELTGTLDRLLTELRLEYSDGIQTVCVSVSIGAVNSGEFGSDFDKLLEYADRAQYYAKEKGKNDYCIYNSSLRLKGYKNRKKELQEQK